MQREGTNVVWPPYFSYDDLTLQRMAASFEYQKRAEPPHGDIMNHRSTLTLEFSLDSSVSCHPLDLNREFRCKI